MPEQKSVKPRLYCYVGETAKPEEEVAYYYELDLNGEEVLDRYGYPKMYRSDGKPTTYKEAMEGADYDK